MATKKDTPLMRQYHQIKSKHPDTILLFRLGDFFETFEDDAILTAKVCGLTLTKRNNGEAENTPLAGFPHHQLDNYLPKLVRAGYRVAVCEQLEDPKQARGIVRRDVVEVVTPGVAFNDKLLDTKRNNYVAAIAIAQDRSGTIHTGLSCADVSTGEYFTMELPSAELGATLEALQPAEVIINKKHQPVVEQLLSKLAFRPAITRLEDWIFEDRFSRDNLLRHFGTASLKGFGIEAMTLGIIAAGVVLHYISETQKGSLPHIRRISAFNPSEHMALDFATRRNLEITFSMHDASHEGTLIAILDKTKTAMGGRLFKKWITRPLRRLRPIELRQSAVRTLVENNDLRLFLQHELSHVGDIERLMSKVCTGRATPRDMISLRTTLQRIPDIRMALLDSNAETLKKIAETLVPMNDVAAMLAQALVDEPPAQVGSGAAFREGFSPELDEIRDAMFSGKNWIASYQEEERRSSGISSLKVGFNNVFGYYIEITNAHRSKVPDNYERKQTLANAERYTTPELKQIEAKVLNAEERIGELEKELFNELRLKVAEQAETAQVNASRLAMVDCLQSFAQAACDYKFCRPELSESEKIAIVDGRHPVVERLLPVGERYIPNSTTIDTEEQQIHIITGPNMSGKSSYLRQVGLIVLLAQIGSYVPATSAEIGIVDTIFTRVGAQDNITAGESTFLVEMQEAAGILNNATRKSLILLDEVGRGTATFDGISIAWAIAEYLHEHIGARTLFATHYHELNELAGRFGRIRNYKADVQEIGETILFTRKIMPGGADHSFGIHVAEMAGLPREVTARAKEIMRTLEQHSSAEFSAEALPAHHPSAARAAVQAVSAPPDNDQPQMSLFEVQLRDDSLRQKLLAIDINSLTPMQALRLIEELQQDLRT